VSEPTWIISLDKRAQAAHEAWLARGKVGEGRLVVEGENLRGARARGDLGGARFVRCDLSDCAFPLNDMGRIELVECTLQRANLQSARCHESIVERSSFAEANLRLARLVSARVTGGDFTGARLENSVWTGARVTGVDLRGAILTDALLCGAAFVGCDLRGADLRRVDLALDLGKAHGTTFEECDLRGALIDGRRLSDATFRRCKLHGLVGKPVLEGAIESIDSDLSAEGDGSAMANSAELAAWWRAT
jgi:uncharacterized protein YjbI with pentapeptide repeats